MPPEPGDHRFSHLEGNACRASSGVRDGSFDIVFGNSVIELVGARRPAAGVRAGSAAPRPIRTGADAGHLVSDRSAHRPAVRVVLPPIAATASAAPLAPDPARMGGLDQRHARADAHIIKLPNLSVPVPQSTAAIEELRQTATRRRDHCIRPGASAHCTRLMAVYCPAVLSVRLTFASPRLRQNQPCLPSNAASSVPLSPTTARPLP